MHECEKFAELIMVWGILKTYKCSECEKEWEEKEDNGEYERKYILKEMEDMKCDICGESTIEEKRICDRCSKVMDDVIREVGPDIWKGIDNCVYIYPMIKRVAEGSLRTQDVVNALLIGEAD
jgi:NAD-dependent SIR2 family protein deacetylase